MTTLIDKLENIRQDMLDEESECLQIIKHASGDYYGTQSRKLIDLAQKRAVIKEAINSIKAFSYHYRNCADNKNKIQVNDRDEIGQDLIKMRGE